MKPSIEQRLYEAYRSGRGIRLSAADVASLLADDAIGTRITDQACIEAGAFNAGVDKIPVSDLPTWRGFKEGLL